MSCCYRYLALQREPEIVRKDDGQILRKLTSKGIQTSPMRRLAPELPVRLGRVVSRRAPRTGPPSYRENVLSPRFATLTVPPDPPSMVPENSSPPSPRERLPPRERLSLSQGRLPQGRLSSLSRRCSSESRLSNAERPPRLEDSRRMQRTPAYVIYEPSGEVTSIWSPSNDLKRSNDRLSSVPRPRSPVSPMLDGPPPSRHLPTDFINPFANPEPSPAPFATPLAPEDRSYSIKIDEVPTITSESTQDEVFATPAGPPLAPTPAIETPPQSNDALDAAIDAELSSGPVVSAPPDSARLSVERAAPARLTPSTAASAKPAVLAPTPSGSSFRSPQAASTDDESRVAGWERKMKELYAKLDDKDCQVPHAVLEELQNDLIDCVGSLGVNVKFFVESTLSGSKSPLKTDGKLVFSKMEISRLASSLPVIKDVLAESYMTFFCKGQRTVGREVDPSRGKTPTEAIDIFLKGIGTGPLGGRSSIDGPVFHWLNFPVVMFATGPVDESKRVPPSPGGGPLKPNPAAECPLRVSVLFEDGGLDARLDKSALELLGSASSVLGRMLTDWRIHSLRVFYINSKKFQKFLPNISQINAKTNSEWNELTFGTPAKVVNEDGKELKDWKPGAEIPDGYRMIGGESSIKWKTLAGGQIITFIEGVADASTDRALALVYDGDKHKNWIPFLSDTKMQFALSSYCFVCSYGVSLPWPMSRRELSILGCATDAFRIDPINAIQMWAPSVPEKATSIFSLPLPLVKPSVTYMEMPCLSFSLTPLSLTRTYLRMVCMVDVKINFIPQAVQNYMAKNMATKMFGNVQDICRVFDTTPYKEVYELNKEQFQLMIEDLPYAVEQANKRGLR